jgi:uncharacterized protein YwgA
MSGKEDVVAAVIAAGGGQMTGRVRLQKVVYLLERLGLNSGLDFDYHHYGPYSRELDEATLDAQEFLGLREDFAHRASDGARYSVFRFDGRPAPNALGDLKAEEARTLLETFRKTNVTVLELAATVDWLWREEKIEDWRREVTKRKGVKVQDGRLERAVELLNSLGLSPPKIAA